MLFAGAAIGVSHLVQSTRAGAVYGLSLAGLVVIANLVKYPAFRFGPLYAASTGTSLLEGYRRQGKWALVLYGLVTLGTMFTVQAAVTIVTAGLAKALLGLQASAFTISGVLLLLCAALVASGGYRWLERAGKAVVSLLAVSTLVATALVLPRMDWAAVPWWPDVGSLSAGDIAFMAALVGWMPSAIDVAVWQSLWTLAQNESSGQKEKVHPGDSSVDFHLGYFGTAFLAICFVVLGAAVLHGSGESVPEAPGAFAAQLISLYTDTLGPWSRPIIGVAAFATMFSTTLTVVDGFPRAITALLERFRGAEDPEAPMRRAERTIAYWVSLTVICSSALAILGYLAETMRTLVDLATTLSFLSAPLLSFLNHRAVMGQEVPVSQQPQRCLWGASWIGIVLQAAFAGYFLLSLFGRE